MRIEWGEAVQSFQQKVWHATVDKTAVFVKEIISDYSWWTCEESDIFRREKLSYQRLNAVGIGPRLLCCDDAARRLIMEAVPQSADADEEPIRAEDDAVCDSLLDVLKTLRGLRDTGLERLTARRLAQIYTAKGEAAAVQPQLVAEISHQLEAWHQTYGHELCFTHGDLHPGNVRAGKGRIVGLIDFEETIESLPVFDGANMAWALSEEPAVCARFASGYEQAFGEPLIPPQEWRRFYLLRGWIVSCYLRNCCAPDVRDRAGNFIFANEPEPQT